MSERAVRSKPVVWRLTAGRLLVFYLSAALFGGNIVLLVDGIRGGGPVVGPALGAVAMTALSLFVLVTSPQRADGRDQRSATPDSG